MGSLLLVALVTALGACGGEGAASAPGHAPPVSSGRPAAPESGEPELVRPGDSEGSPSLRVTFLGTSLTEGLGLEIPTEEAWPIRVGELADSVGLDVQVLNAGLGGETSAGALGRLDWVLQGEPDVLVIETGANDGLRGLPVEQLENNLTEIVRRALEMDPELRVAIVPMEAPTNMGAGYTSAFRAVYPRVAERTGVPILPFLLEGVGGVPELNQGDGIHPTAEGHRIMARTVWQGLEGVLRDAAGAPAGTAP